MRCPYCKTDDDKVIDSRTGEQGRVIRRRRQCLRCDKRFTTYERLEEAIKLSVIKKDGSRIPFERSRIIEGVRKACYKRPVSIQQINELAECVEEDLLSQAGQEVHSSLIGRLTLSRLKKLDKVAYIRFASIYLEFEQVDQFIEEAHQALKPDLM